MSKISHDSAISFPEKPISDDLALVKWIEQSGDRELAKLVTLAKEKKPLPSQKLEKIVSSLINDPQDLCGKIMASRDVKHHAEREHPILENPLSKLTRILGFQSIIEIVMGKNGMLPAELTANCSNIANLIDFVGNFSFFLYAFQSFIAPIDFALALLSDGLLLVFSNKTATIAGNKTKHGNFWSKVAVGTMIALGVLKSSVSGVGGELLMNQPELKRILAQELIESQKNKVAELKESSSTPELEARKQELKEKQAQLTSLPRSHPRWNSLYQEINGLWKDRDRDWSQLAKEQLSLSELVKRLEVEASQSYITAKAILDEKLISRSKIGNDLLFLEQEMPYVYASAFDDEGNINSGSKAIELAVNNFLSKLLTGDWSSLGFSLFFFTLSVLTSSASILLTLRYADREDVQQSQIQEEKANKLLGEILTQYWLDNLDSSEKKTSN